MIGLDQLRPGCDEVEDGTGHRYLVVRRSWQEDREALTIELVRADGPSDPRRPWTPPPDEEPPPLPSPSELLDR